MATRVNKSPLKMDLDKFEKEVQKTVKRPKDVKDSYTYFNNPKVKEAYKKAAETVSKKLGYTAKEASDRAVAAQKRKAEAAKKVTNKLKDTVVDTTLLRSDPKRAAKETKKKVKTKK